MQQFVLSILSQWRFFASVGDIPVTGNFHFDAMARSGRQRCTDIDSGEFAQGHPRR